jgi:imidazolonepropionase-like amidohydrolase
MSPFLNTFKLCILSVCFLKIKAFVGATLINGVSSVPVEDSVILVEGETITSVGTLGKLSVPPNADVIDVHGRTVMPGLIEGHNHPLGERDFRDPGFKKYYDNMVQSPVLGLLKGVQVIQEMLTYGVTSVRIPHPTIANAPELRGEWLVALKRAIERGYIVAPRVVAGGCVLPTGGHLNSLAPPFVLNKGWRGADGPWEIRKQTRECLTYEVDFIKLIGPGHKRYKPGEGPEHTCMTRDEIEAAVQEAHWRGVPVAAHAKNGPGLRYAVEAGVDSIEHGTNLYEQLDLITHMARNGQYLVPTLGMFFYEPLIDAYDEAEPGTKNAFKSMQPDLIKNFKHCREEGVKIAAGTDNTYWDVPGLAWELYTYVHEGGMKPMDAIISGTKTCAEMCKLEKTGCIEQGKLADLIVLEGDPLIDINILQNSDQILAVYKEGVKVAEEGRLLNPNLYHDA